MSDYEYPPGTILGSIVGSQAQGFATETSDTDRGCVFTLPILSITTRQVPDRELSLQLHDPDCWGHELVKFVKLARNCNPTILELLWADETREWATAEGMLLLNIRNAFLSKERFVDAFLGFANGQMFRAEEEEPRRSKARRHALRLMHVAYYTLLGGEFGVRLPDGDVAQIRRLVDDAAEMPPEYFNGHFRDLTNLVRRTAEKSPLPDRPDDELIRSTVEEIRVRQMVAEIDIVKAPSP